MLPKASVNLEEPPTCDGGDTQKSARDATFMDTTDATSKVAMNMHIYILDATPTTKQHIRI